MSKSLSQRVLDLFEGGFGGEKIISFNGLIHSLKEPGEGPPSLSQLAKVLNYLIRDERLEIVIEPHIGMAFKKVAKTEQSVA